MDYDSFVVLLASADRVVEVVTQPRVVLALTYATQNAVKNLGITKPGVYTLPIPPIGAGAHVWGGYKFGDVKVVSTGTGVP